MDSGLSERRGSAMESASSHTWPHLVNTSGRSSRGRSRSSRPTTSSECPSPYTAAVSIQLMPRSSAWRIAASEAASSCGPQPYFQPPPPMAHAPNPTGVISSSLDPSRLRGNTVASMFTSAPGWTGAGGNAPAPAPSGYAGTVSRCSIFVPMTSRNFASHAGWAGQAGEVTMLAST